jgi:hypothetical protein
MDFVADIGDGYDATFSIALALAQPTLNIANTKTRRGDILVIGGDLVYPEPSEIEIERRFIRPYKKALNRSYNSPNSKLLEKNDSALPHMYCVPGNHDYLDGLKVFSEYIIEAHHVGGWKLPQTNSFFGFLVKNWLVLGFDDQIAGGEESDIDQNQFEYFLALIEKNPRCPIIIIMHSPWYILSKSLGKRTQNLFAIAKIRIKLVLSGDLHYFSHYAPISDESPHLIVSGGGGGYLHSTWELPTKMDVNISNSSINYTLRESFPDSQNLNPFYTSFPYSMDLLLGFGFVMLLLSYILNHSKIVIMTVFITLRLYLVSMLCALEKFIFSKFIGEVKGNTLCVAILLCFLVMYWIGCVPDWDNFSTRKMYEFVCIFIPYLWSDFDFRDILSGNERVLNVVMCLQVIFICYRIFIIQIDLFNYCSYIFYSYIAVFSYGLDIKHVNVRGIPLLFAFFIPFGFVFWFAPHHLLLSLINVFYVYFIFSLVKLTGIYYLDPRREQSLMVIIVFVVYLILAFFITTTYFYCMLYLKNSMNYVSLAAIDNYKNFVRIKFSETGLTIFPVFVERVKRDFSSLEIINDTLLPGLQYGAIKFTELTLGKIIHINETS